MVQKNLLKNVQEHETPYMTAEKLEEIKDYWMHYVE